MTRRTGWLTDDLVDNKNEQSSLMDWDIWSPQWQGLKEFEQMGAKQRATRRVKSGVLIKCFPRLPSRTC